ncbi:hypothetical protein [Spirosoma soli]
MLGLCTSPSANAQKSQRSKTSKSTVVQGICGNVVVKRGNYMPSPDSPRPNPGGVPAEREVLIFPLLNLGQVDAGDNGFVNSVREAKPVKTVKTDKNGKFCVSLPAGRYTVLVREPKGLYANLFDSQSNINPVTVSKNRLSQHRLEITHGAVF